MHLGSAPLARYLWIMSEGEYSKVSPCANKSFTTTHWSVVRAGGVSEISRSAEAMEELCRFYWYPLYVYIRRRGYSAEDAEDLTQEFWARLIEKHWLDDADPSKGRFRTFLLSTLNHFLANERRNSRAAKRGGGKRLISLDDTAEARYAREADTALTPEKLYERRWALSLLGHALNRLRKGYKVADKSRHFDLLKRYLSEHAVDGDYTWLGKELEMSTGAVATAVHRLRQQYRELVREEVAHTVDSPAELKEEIRWLLAAVG
jgi:RNA polymerase sigma factor (sigma-70 family)